MDQLKYTKEQELAEIARNTGVGFNDLLDGKEIFSIEYLDPRPTCKFKEFEEMINRKIGIKTPQDKGVGLSDLLYCDGCPHLHPKEWQQTVLKEPHKCDVYDRKINHNGHHPQLPTPDYCIVTGWRN